MNRCPMCDYYQAESNALKDHIMLMADAVGKTFKHEYTAEIGDKILLEKYTEAQQGLSRKDAEIAGLKAEVERLKAENDCLRSDNQRMKAYIKKVSEGDH